jgi:hypothetical protein
MAKTKAKVAVKATGRAMAYIQEVKGKKLGRPRAVVITTIRVGKAAPVKKVAKRRRK